VKIVLDSNVLISAFAARGLCADLFRELVASHEIIISDYILAEVYEKLVGKLRISRPVANGIREILMQYVSALGELPEIKVAIRDPDDVPVVALAVSVAADVLITGDRDLLDIASDFPIVVLSPREFYDR
jgi:uncharacterized protein